MRIMAGDVVNLRQFRKQKARAAKDAEAEANRARYGRTKAEKTVSRAEVERREKTLDGAKRDEAPE
jgi:hypothetical protein